MLITKAIIAYVFSFAFVVYAKGGGSQKENKTIDGTIEDRSKRLRGITIEEEHGLDCTLVLAETQFENEEEERHWECEVDSSSQSSKRGHFLAINVAFEEDYEDPVAGEIESGTTTFHADGVTLSESSATITRGAPKLSQKSEHRRRLPTTGIRSALVVRVQANDATTSASEADLARDFFGIDDSRISNDPVGVGSEDSFKLSSTLLSKLDFAPVSDNKVKNGVYTVYIDANVAGEKNGDVRNVVLDQLRSDFGSSDLNASYDHVMVCMPPGTITNQGKSRWTALGIINGYVSLFNNDWCMSASAKMREISHNLGLTHSQEAGSSHESSTQFFPSSTESPPTCAGIPYDISLVTSDSSSQPASWTFAFHEDSSIVAKHSNQEYLSDSTYSESGCLKPTCYTFSIKNVSKYNLKINGVVRASSDKFVGEQASLFGTCRPLELEAAALKPLR